MNSRPASRARWTPLPLALAAALAACATPADLPPAPPTLQAQALGASAADSAAERPVLPDFGDAGLASLMRKAVAEHPGSQVARARLARAQAVTGLASSALGGQVGVQVDATRQRYSENGMVPPPLAGHVYSSGNTQLVGGWELDLWGRRAAELRSALGIERAAQADIEVATQSLATQVGQAYVQLARLEALEVLARRTLAQREETLKLIRQRVRAGLDTQVELAQGEGALPEARAQIEALAGQTAQARHALSALTLQHGSVLEALHPSLDRLAQADPRLPADPRADLLGERPDLRAARERVEAATQDLRSARAQFYPNVNLSAFIGFSAIGLDRLTESGSRQWGVGPALHLPLLDGGRLRAQQRVKAADLDAAVDAYNATLLDALREATDQLSLRQALSRQRAEQEQALAAAESAWRFAQQRFAAGLGSYLVVLNAETQVLAQRRQGVELRAQQLLNSLQLARALGARAPAPPAPHAAAGSATTALPTDRASSTNTRPEDLPS